MRKVVGFVPAAGVGSRMQGFPIFKEMLPIPASMSSENKTSILIDNTIMTLIKSGIRTIIFAVNDEKRELVSYINREYVYTKQIQAAFVYQDINTKQYGVPFAIKSAYDFLEGKTVLMRFPDTILYGNVDLNRLLHLHKTRNSELTLGVFPTAHPERLGPVLIGENGKIEALEDKPVHPFANNTWNCILWEPDFTEEVSKIIKIQESKGSDSEIILADIMRLFISSRNKAYAYEYKQGACIDVSSIKELENIWKSTYVIE